MRIILIVLLAVFLAECGVDSRKENGGTKELESPDISIQIQGAPAGQAYLIGSYGDQNFAQDTAIIGADGTIVFQRKEPYPPGFYYVLLPDQNYLQCLISEDQTFSMSTRTGDLIHQMQVNGSVDNELFYQSLQYEMEMQPKFEQVAQTLSQIPPGTDAYDQIKSRQDQLVSERTTYLQNIFDRHPTTLFTKFKMAGQNPDIREVRRPDGSLDLERQRYLFRTQFWDNVDFSDERLLRTPVIFNKLKRYITELTVQSPDSIKQSATFLIDKVADYPEYFEFFVNWIALNYEPTKTTLMDSEAVFVHMVQNYFTYERAFWSDSTEIYALQLRAHEMASSLVGQKGPDVTANDPDGRPRSIMDIQAPYIIVYLYNPDCDHCIEQTPKLVNFYRQWKPKGVEVYAIAVDTDEQKWKNFIAANRMDWINVFDSTNQAIYATYFVDNTPEIYVLNPGRIIIGKNLKVNQIETVIQNDLN